MKKIVLIWAILMLVLQPLTFAEDDFQYWSRYSIKAVDTQYVDFINYWDFRVFPDAARLAYWQTTQKLQYDFFKFISFVTGYTYLESRTKDSKSGDTEFKNQHRLELEINPHWEGKRVKISNRNRFEFRWIEDRGSDHARYRNLLEFEFPIKWERAKFLKSVYINNEIFVDFNLRELNENRVTPFGISFKINKKLSFKLFYLIQSKKGARDWSSAQVLGTNVGISF